MTALPDSLSLPEDGDVDRSVVAPIGRLGRDGKRHPGGAGEIRARIRAALAEDPGASLRTIAARVHASPETVRRVRRAFPPTELRTDPEPVTSLPTRDAVLHRRPDAPRWSSDTACTSTEEGARFAAWFDERHVEDADLWEHAGSIPTSRLYEIVDEARRRSRFWLEFAERLETRLSKRS